LDFHKAIKILSAQRWVFLSVALVSFALVALAPTRETQVVPIYKSRAKILLTPSSGNVRAYGGTVSAGVNWSQQWFADEVILKELLASEKLLSRVSEKSDRQLPWFELKGKMSIDPISSDHRGVKLFAIEYQDFDPKETQKMARLVADEFATYVQELSAQEHANTRKFIEQLVEEAEQRRLGADEALMAIREKYLGMPTDEEITHRQQDLESERQELSREVSSLQAEVASISSYTSGSVAGAPWAVRQEQTGAIGSLEQNVADLKLDLAKKREVYTDDSDVVKAAQKRLETANSLYQESLGEYVQSLYNDKSTHLRQLIKKSQSVSAQLNSLLQQRMTQEDRRELAKLERKRNLWEENHLSLLQQLYQARVVEQASRRAGSVNILEQPRLGAPVATASPVATPRSKKIALAIPFCLIMGIGAAFLRDHLYSSLRLRPRIEEALEIPVIAVIPSTPSELTVDWERFKRPLVGDPPDDLAETRSSRDFAKSSRNND